MFSSRLAHTAGRNRLAAALDRRRSAGLPLVDLTLSNPTRAGFAYPPDLLDGLAGGAALRYEPEPFGLAAAREAVSKDFARRGVAIPSDRVVLTASTSEAYSLLFKLLCDPGDIVLSPRPSYPLVEQLASLDGVSIEQYSLEYHGRWTFDLDGLREKLSKAAGRARAVIMISPNNPTGSVVTDDELAAAASLAAEHGAAIVADEVFGDYAMTDARPRSVLRQETALTFALGGLSKSAGLPQVKLGWVGVGGPGPLVVDALERLEVICDAYLSVSTPVQVAAAELMEAGASVRQQIQNRVRENLARLVDAASTRPACSVPTVEAGWYAVLQVPAIRSEEAIVLDLLDRTGILVHPGYFFDFEREAFVVISLLPEPAVFQSAVETLFREIGETR